MRFALRDDLRDSPDLFQGNSGMGSDRSSAAAARAWICDSDKLRDKMTAGLCRGVNGVSPLDQPWLGWVSTVQVDERQESADRGHAVEGRAG